MLDLAQEVDVDQLIAGLRDFIDRVVVPLEDSHSALLSDHRGDFYDDRGGYSAGVVDLIRRTRMESARAGYYGMFCPPEIGGGGLGNRINLLAYEFITRHYGPQYMLPIHTIAHWATGPSFLCAEFTESLSARLLDRISSGEVGMCFGMSEPDAGSDPWMMRTRAVRDGDDWVINGVKQWITNSPHADYCYLFAVTDPDRVRERTGGISCFVVSMSTPGVSVDSVIRILGEVGGNEGILSFADVRVPGDSLVGQEGAGFKLAMRGVGYGRVFNSARALGYSRWALEKAAKYAGTRVTFGKRIGEHQGVSFKLAESAMDIYGARHAALDMATRLDLGQPAIREMAMSKALCCEAMLRVADRCMQVCGGMGVTNEMGLYKVWLTARTLQLADGSGEILRETVAKRLLRGDLDF
jgi:acyl-CoA dehydrogenase